MLYKSQKSPLVIDRGNFIVRAAPPGLSVPNHDDHGYGALALVAESFMAPGTLIAMHQHVQDEIVSWVPEGVMRHDDRTHGKRLIDASNLLVMNAGRAFWHEERTFTDDPPLRMLQIFIRPHSTDLEPKLQHGPLAEATQNHWRLIVGPEMPARRSSCATPCMFMTFVSIKGVQPRCRRSPVGTAISSCSRGSSKQ